MEFMNPVSGNRAEKPGREKVNLVEHGKSAGKLGMEHGKERVCLWILNTTQNRQTGEKSRTLVGWSNCDEVDIFLYICLHLDAVVL